MHYKDTLINEKDISITSPRNGRIGKIWSYKKDIHFYLGLLFILQKLGKQ
jgi:hypothetical protein